MNDHGRIQFESEARRFAALGRHGRSLRSGTTKTQPLRLDSVSSARFHLYSDPISLAAAGGRNRVFLLPSPSPSRLSLACRCARLSCLFRIHSRFSVCQNSKFQHILYDSAYTGRVLGSLLRHAGLGRAVYLSGQHLSIPIPRYGFYIQTLGLLLYLWIGWLTKNKHVHFRTCTPESKEKHLYRATNQRAGGA